MSKRTVLNKFLEDRTYEIALNPKYDGYQRELKSLLYTFFDKKIVSGAGVTSKVVVNVNEGLALELHKTVIKNIQNRKVNVRFKENI